jgi:hypothetical protein
VIRRLISGVCIVGSVNSTDPGNSTSDLFDLVESTSDSTRGSVSS